MSTWNYHLHRISDTLSIEVKYRMTSGQFLCTPPKSPKVKKVWCFVDLYKKLSEPPDFYILEAKDLIKINKLREKEIQTKGEIRGKKYHELSSLDVSLQKLKQYNRG